MSKLQEVLRVLKAAFSDTDDLELWLRERNPQNAKELNYWIDQYERYQANKQRFGSSSMI